MIGVMSALSGAGSLLFGGAMTWVTVSIVGLGLATFASRSLLDAGEARCDREHLTVAVRAEQIGRQAERKQSEALIENERQSWQELHKNFIETEQEMAQLRATQRSNSAVCVSKQFLERLRGNEPSG